MFRSLCYSAVKNEDIAINSQIQNNAINDQQIRLNMLNPLLFGFVLFVCLFVFFFFLHFLIFHNLVNR